MDKIKALLEKAGCKPELVSQIAESLNKFKTTVREELENEYAAKVEQAKKVCIEETESHKRDLARRVQVFCETKSAAIEAQLAQKSALNESEAESRLQEIKDLLEGIQPSGPQNSEVTAALKKAQRQVQIANEERIRAVEIANRKVAIAEKALKQNRALTTENAKLKDSLKNAGSTTMTEGRQTAQPGKRNRIDQSRQKSRQPVTTRPTLLENQDRRPVPQRQNPQMTGTSNGNGYGIGDIAQTMDEDLI